MKSVLLVSKGLLCLYDKQNNTWLLVDMEFLFSCLTTGCPSSSCEMIILRNNSHGGIMSLYGNIYGRPKE